MRIIVRRSGGFAGTAETLHDIDTDNLDAASAAEVENLVRALDAAAQGDGTQAQPVGADFINYEVTLSDGQGQRTLSIIDDNSPRLDPLHRLLNYLSSLRRLAGCFELEQRAFPGLGRARTYFDGQSTKID